MFGIIYYLYMLFFGFVYASLLYSDKSIYHRVWLGGVFGSLIAMSGVALCSFVFDFTIISHIVLIIATAVPACIIFARRTKGISKQPEEIVKPQKSAKAKSGSKTSKAAAQDKPANPFAAFFKPMFSNPCGDDMAMTHKIFLLLVLPLSLIMWIILTGHIMTPYSGGGIATGQCTYGDLAFHMDIITSIAEQGTFPPDYSILAGVRLGYPFFIDMLSSSLVVLGTPLRWAILAPSYVFVTLLVMGFYFLAHKLTGKRSVAILAAVLFFLNGGFGFAYIFDGVGANPSQLTDVFTGYYRAPTQLGDNNIDWANTITDMIVPQRTTMAGWTMLAAALWLLLDAVDKKTVKAFLTVGIVAGCMPMIHTHSFMAVAAYSAVMLVYVFFTDKGDRKDFCKRWGIFAGTAAVLAIPQLVIWTLSQTGTGEGFLTVTLGWDNGGKDNVIWYWLKNWGVIALATIPALFGTSNRNRALAVGAAILFILANTIQFQPNLYDNNKIFFAAYFIAVILSAEFMVTAYNALKEVRAREFIAAIVILASCLSGSMSIAREIKSNGQYQTFDEGAVAFADYIKENTEPDAVFATYTHHLNPVSALAGRSLYAGASLFMGNHGYGTELSERVDNLEELYSADTTKKMQELADEYGIDYIVVTSNEKNNYDINNTALSGLDKVYSENGNSLYKVH